MRLADYDRTVIGYHGTRRSVALRIVQGLEGFTPSTNDDDWLGHGVYFWEHAPRQARWWAERRKEKHGWPAGEEVAVLAAIIRLGRCVDMLDPTAARRLKRYHDEFVAAEHRAGREPVKNVRTHKRLDCAVFQYAYAALAATEGAEVDSSRAVYVPTGRHRRVWRSSWIVQEAHIQICVRNPACIAGAWLLKDDPSEG